MAEYNIWPLSRHLNRHLSIGLDSHCRRIRGTNNTTLPFGRGSASAVIQGAKAEEA